MPSRGRYKLVRKIADGGMAEIYLGIQRGLEGFERPVVLKRILGQLLAEPQFKNLMIDEAHVAMSLTHSNITQVLDLGHAKGRYYLVLEFVDGWDFNLILNRIKKTELALPPELALFVAGEVCRALAYAHSKKRNGRPMNIVHRDVSPHNVLVSEQGEVKLTDFGIAKAMVKRENTIEGVIKGKLAFMSPEQAAGAPIDARSDLFSVGTLIYLSVTGKRPFEAPTDLESILRVQKCEFPRPDTVRPDLPAALTELVMKAMTLRPSDRFQTADEMLDAIENLQRTTFQPAGKSELKRWLAELERRDGVPPIGRMPAGAPDPNETMELGDNDIEFEDSKLLPGGQDRGTDVAFKPTMPEIDTGPLGAPIATTMSPAITGPTVIDRQDRVAMGHEATTPPAPERSATGSTGRRSFATLVVLALGGLATWMLARRPNKPPPDVGLAAAHHRQSKPPAMEAAQPLPAETAPAPATTIVDAGVDGLETEAAESEGESEVDEDQLLAMAEPVEGVVIGEDPADAVETPPAPEPKERGKRHPVPHKPARKPPAPPPVVSVRVVTTPPGAIVRLNKRVFGRSPMNLRFKSGISYELSFVKKGYETASKRFKVDKRARQTVKVALRKQRPRKTEKRGFFQRLFGG